MSIQKERCWLFVPGHSQKMVDKALGLDVDVIIFDLEDGVPPDKKESARCVVAEALGQPASCAKRFVRVHAPAAVCRASVARSARAPSGPR